MKSIRLDLRLLVPILVMPVLVVAGLIWLQYRPGRGVLEIVSIALLSSAGLGFFFFLPSFIEGLLPARKGTPEDRVLSRYRDFGPYHRLFPRFKMLLDPMFSELPSLLPASGIRTVLDVGCGYGVPACWVLERYPGAILCGIDPDPGRIRVASLAVGKRGTVTVARAPDIPAPQWPVELVIMLDIIHFLDDDQLTLTLRRLSAMLGREGRLIIRVTIPPAYSFPWVWWMENLKNKAAGIRSYYRSADEIEPILLQTGFEIEMSGPSGSKGDMLWFLLHLRK